MTSKSAENLGRFRYQPRLRARFAGTAGGAAGEVVINFKRDLTSDAAKQVHRQLRSLYLPTIDVR